MRRALLTTAAALTVAAAVGAAPTAAGGATTCPAAALVVWLDTEPGHTAGSTYYTLELTNLSRHPCTLRGYPGLAAIALDGRRLGSPAARNAIHPVRDVTLAVGASAVVLLQITDVHNVPRTACRPVTAAGLRVHVPGSAEARVVPFPFPACARTGAVVLHVGPVQRG